MGRCMHDEFTQAAYGHQLLMDELAHSSTQGYLLSRCAGFDALYFTHMDCQVYGECMKNMNLEFVWLRRCFVLVDEVEQFVNKAEMRGSASKGKHNMYTLFYNVNQGGRVNVLYLSYHTDLKREEGLIWNRAVGLVQRHDGLSGTEKQSVADANLSGLNGGTIQAEKEMNEVLYVIGEEEPYHFCLLVNTGTFSIPITRKSAEMTMLSGDVNVCERNVYVALLMHSEMQKEYFEGVDYDDTDAASAGSDSDNGDVIVLEKQLLRVEMIKSSGSIPKLANKKKDIQIPLLSLFVAYIRRSKVTIRRLVPVTIVNLQTNNGATTSRTSIERPVGPVPIADMNSNEVIVRFDTGESIASDATLYTDSNVLEVMKRIRNNRDTWNLTLHDNMEAGVAEFLNEM
ncbi:Lysosomal alpha-mannosidase [Phytophthora megakarya]|uniref:Lysosomal alpha-mannosidase n=1 Tax=Phytophthora megakarya TaxID=4795 RepID=A0A225VH73_9STRA|nr:Lysosomal alpha-mannosidase [Phytophthora megakarya]